jgi:alpha-tubulin suppressor-like RCC1 family protein
MDVGLLISRIVSTTTVAAKALTTIVVAVFASHAHAADPAIAVGINHTLALDRAGNIYAWGSDADGKLGQGRQLAFSTPLIVNGLPKLSQISVNNASGAQIAALDVGGNVWTWGEIGIWLGPRGNVPIARPGKVEGIDRVKQISAGRSSVVALKEDGTVWFWGVVDALGANGFAAVPTQVSGLTGVSKIAAGDRYILAQRTDGSVWGIGRNRCGELGDGTQIDRATWVQVQLPAAPTAIFASAATSAAIINGVAHTWGQANCAGPVLAARPISFQANVRSLNVSSGAFRAALVNDTVQTAFFTEQGSLTIVNNTDLRAATAISSNLSNIYALTAGGVVQSIGSNNYGQLGNQTFTAAQGAATVGGGLRNVVSIEASGEYAMALDSGGTLYAWGADRFGQISGETPGGVTAPKLVKTDFASSIKSVHEGLNQSFAVLTDGRLLGWGDNASGSLGTRDNVPRSRPVLSGVSNVAGVAAGPDIAIALKRDGSVTRLTLQGANLEQPVAGLSGISSVAAGGYVNLFFAVDSSGRLFGWGDNRNGALGNGVRAEGESPVQAVTLPGPVDAVSTSGSHTLVRLRDGRLFAWGVNSNGQLGDGTRVDRLSPVEINLAAASSTAAAGASSLAAGVVNSVVRLSDGGVATWGFGNFTGLGNPTDALTPTRIAGLSGITSVSAGYWSSAALRSDGTVYVWGESRAGAREATLGDGSLAIRLKPVLALRVDGQGRTDTDDWYLDLDSNATNSVPSALVPSLAPVAISAGSSNSFSLGVNVNTRATNLNDPIGLFIFARISESQITTLGATLGPKRALQSRAANDPVLVQLTPTGWQEVVSQLKPLATNIAGGAASAQGILRNVNLDALQGARFCVGVGTDATQMLQSASVAELLAVTGSGVTSSSLPCLLSGAYVTGPQTTRQGSPAVFKASVVGQQPSGNVQFKDGAQNLGAAIALANSSTEISSASFSTSALSVGDHAITVSYAGDARNAASTSAVAGHTVLAANAPVVVSVSGPTRINRGDVLRLQIDLRGDAPTGTVLLREGANNLSSGVSLVNGVAAVSLSNLAVGQRNIIAVYSGDARNAAANSAAFVVTVAESNGAVELSGSAQLQLVASRVSMRVGQMTQLTATHSDLTVAGGASFTSESNAIANSTFAAGVARADFVPDAPGRYFIRARFDGDANRPSVQSTAIEIEVQAALSSSADTDGDGVNDALEDRLGLNPFVRDNDVFANTALGQRLFVMQIYRDFLNREGDDAGINFWAGEIAAGRQSRVSMAETFFNSAEFQGRLAPIARLYFATYLRVPDYGGLQFWAGQFASGQSLTAIGNVFVTAPEFTARYGALNNRDFVDRLYQNVLGRPADEGGITFWTGQLNSGVTRGGVLVSFSESPEYVNRINNSVYVNAMYVAFLRRAADAGGFEFWRVELDRGRSGRELIGSFIASAEYRARFLP